jgi:type VI secretion system protein ImpH
VAAKKRQPDPDLEPRPLQERLFREFYRFSFFQAVHLLETFSQDSQALGSGLEPGKEPVRFSVKPDLSFPATEITALEEGSEASPARMSVAFMGLIGPSGVLPYGYTDLAIERERQKDSAMTAFFDIFHHRILTLFYLAWKKQRFPENYAPGGKDRLTGHLLSLCGLGTPGLSGSIGLPPESLAFYTGLLAMPAPSAVSIEAAVSYLSGVRAQVDQFVERIIPLSPEDHTRIGTANAQLGEDALCGSYVWDCETKFRVDLGPMGYDDFTRFLPGGVMLGPIFSLVRYRVGIEYEFDLKIILSRDEVPPCMIGGDSRLGMTSWLLKPGTEPGEDVFITIGEDQVMQQMSRN